jgi:hypothetical protein
MWTFKIFFWPNVNIRDKRKTTTRRIVGKPKVRYIRVPIIAIEEIKAKNRGVIK